MKAVNGHKSHMLDDLRVNCANIFAGLPSINPAVLHSNDLAHICNDPIIKRYMGSSGILKKWPDLFYNEGKASNIKHIFCIKWLLRVCSFIHH